MYDLLDRLLTGLTHYFISFSAALRFMIASELHEIDNGHEHPAPEHKWMFCDDAANTSSLRKNLSMTDHTLETLTKQTPHIHHENMKWKQQKEPKANLFPVQHYALAIFFQAGVWPHTTHMVLNLITKRHMLERFWNQNFSFVIVRLFDPDKKDDIHW